MRTCAPSPGPAAGIRHEHSRLELKRRQKLLGSHRFQPPRLDVVNKRAITTAPNLRFIEDNVLGSFRAFSQLHLSIVLLSS